VVVVVMTTTAYVSERSTEPVSSFLLEVLPLTPRCGPKFLNARLIGLTRVAFKNRERYHCPFSDVDKAPHNDVL
jgi:hypothetical protein